MVCIHARTPSMIPTPPTKNKPIARNASRPERIGMHRLFSPPSWVFGKDVPFHWPSSAMANGKEGASLRSGPRTARGMTPSAATGITGARLEPVRAHKNHHATTQSHKNRKGHTPTHRLFQRAMTPNRQPHQSPLRGVGRPRSTPLTTPQECHVLFPFSPTELADCKSLQNDEPPRGSDGTSSSTAKIPLRSTNAPLTRLWHEWTY